MAFTLEKQEDDQEDLAKVCAIQTSVDLTFKHHLFTQKLLPSRTNRTMTKAEVPLFLRGTEGFVHWSRCVEDLSATKIVKSFGSLGHWNTSYCSAGQHPWTWLENCFK